VGAHYDQVAAALLRRAENSGHGLAFVQPMFHGHLAVPVQAMSQRSFHLFAVVPFSFHPWNRHDVQHE
jgi:hypothetical protein